MEWTCDDALNQSKPFTHAVYFNKTYSYTFCARSDANHSMDIWGECVSIKDELTLKIV